MIKWGVNGSFSHSDVFMGYPIISEDLHFVDNLLLCSYHTMVVFENQSILL